MDKQRYILSQNLMQCMLKKSAIEKLCHLVMISYSYLLIARVIGLYFV